MQWGNIGFCFFGVTFLVLLVLALGTYSVALADPDPDPDGNLLICQIGCLPGACWGFPPCPAGPPNCTVAAPPFGCPPLCGCLPVIFCQCFP